MRLKNGIALLMAFVMLASTFVLSGCNIGGFQPIESITTPTESTPAETTPGETTPEDVLYKLEMQTVFEMAKAAGYTGTLEDLIAMFKGERGPSGRDGISPHIGYNGNWWVGNTDLGVAAQGAQGPQGPQGEPGRGITKIELINGCLIVTYTDGTVENIGSITNNDPNPDLPEVTTPGEEITTPVWETPMETTPAWETPMETTPPDEPTPDTPTGIKQAEYNTTTSVMPSNWNELTYADNNDTQIMDYINSSFFDYDYKFEGDVKYNADGSINKAGIVQGAYTTNYSAATKLEDVTALVAAKWGYTAEQVAEGGYAWKITLRDDLKWDDGTPITAADFVYSMQAQLDPNFMNFRGNTYYDTLRIKNSRGYFFQNQEGTYETVASQGYASNQAALDAGEVLYMNLKNLDNELLGWGITTAGLVDEQGNPMPDYLAYNDTTVFNTPDGWATGSEDWLFDGSMIWGYIQPGGPYAQYCEPGGGYDWVSIYIVNEIREMAWENVGIYSIDSENAIVICLDRAYDFLLEDGSLSYQAAYYMSRLPLVKRDLYEANKVAPKERSDLWTTTYNTSLESTASWGPYKLVRFEAGSDYRLEINPYWYGWNMEEYKNQYNITAINCMKIAEQNTKWMGFLAGIFDDAVLNSDNIEDYLYSKYATWTKSTGTFGMQLFSDLDTLKGSGNNNGILAIREFRQAMNLGLNRTEICEKIWPGSATPCLGIVNDQYYYDIENAPNLADGGIYRNSVQAKQALLRAYGYIQTQDGSWSINEMSGLTLDEAYESFTGYNLELAKAKMAEAVNILLANAEYYGYDASKDITIIYGSSVDNTKQRERAAYIQGVIDSLIAGTALEGKIKVVFDASAGSQWSEAFRAGYTQIGFGYGFSGNPFNPFDIAGAFVDPDDDLNYHALWDTSAEMITITMPEGDYAGAGQTITMSALNWYFCINGLAKVNNQKYTYNWDAGYAPSNARLTVLAALEELVIKESRSIMLIGDYSGSLLGAKFSNLTDEYNFFMGHGGIRYMVVEYTDAEWEEFVQANNGDISDLYRQTN